MNSNPAASNVTCDNTRWKNARRLLLAVALSATLLAVFYTVENWRGGRAWENRRRQLEAKGEVLDWAAYIPAPVPEDQNFFTAPKMQEWFVKGSPAALSQPANAPKGESPFWPGAANPRKEVDLVLAEVKIITGAVPPVSQPDQVVLRFDDPASREQAAKWLGEAVGPWLVAANRGILLARPLDQYQPAHWVLQAKSVPSLKELTDFFPDRLVTGSAKASREEPYLGVDSAGGDLFRIRLKAPVYGAADYLEWTAPLVPNFDLVRLALQRPYARIDCDYEQPYAIGIPDFIHLRQACQVASQRAQCDLLLGRPEAAWHELALVHDLSQILLARPSGKPITLVGAMIYVAINGLEAAIIRDGLNLHVWREEQLVALQQQLNPTDLLGPVVEALREERAATSRTFETTKRAELIKLFGFESWPKVALRWMPRGWFYQNMAAGAKLEQEALSMVDSTNHVVRPRPVIKLVAELTSASEQRSPYHFLVAAALPNFAKALQNAAATETLLDQARLACALERFRLAHGQYPETLQALTPGLIGTLPHDLIGGQPLKYRRISTGGYLLYSVGWNEKDDDGVPGKSREDGDWVWQVDAATGQP